MFKRLLKLPKNQHLFLFGARNTGKSTLLANLFPEKKGAVWFDLLDPLLEDELAKHPDEFAAKILALPKDTSHVVIDEIQKIPMLLDLIHKLMRSTHVKFIMTGSSARKLKFGHANLLAGRAFVYDLFPLSFLELGDVFNLTEALCWGTLPQIFQFESNEEKIKFLQSYALTYLKEEIWAEHFIKRLDPFRLFLEVAAQCNGKIINYSNIARDVGVDDKTIKSYFDILEDTLIGFHLPAYTGSFRKRLSQKPKFYFFDTGVVRALSRTLTVELKPKTHAFGDFFEQLAILECLRLAKYSNKEYRFSYLRTKDDVEIDLVVERPGQPLLLIEIKSNDKINEHDIGTFQRLGSSINNAEKIVLCRNKTAKKYNDILVLPWQEGVKRYFYD